MVVTMGCTRLHHRSWYGNREVVTISTIVKSVEDEFLQKGCSLP